MALRASVANSQRGATLLEVSVLSTLILVFVVIATQRIWELRVAAERAAILSMAGKLRSALGIEVAKRAVRGGLDAVIEMDGSNPILLLDKLPAGYLGELDAADPATVAGYSWYFHPQAGVLVYRVANSDYFSTPLAAPARVLFQVRLDYADSNGNQRFDPGEESLRGLLLEQLNPYRWELP